MGEDRRVGERGHEYVKDGVGDRWVRESRSNCEEMYLLEEVRGLGGSESAFKFCGPQARELLEHLRASVCEVLAARLIFVEQRTAFLQALSTLRHYAPHMKALFLHPEPQSPHPPYRARKCGVHVCGTRYGASCASVLYL